MHGYINYFYTFLSVSLLSINLSPFDCLLCFFLLLKHNLFSSAWMANYFWGFFHFFPLSLFSLSFLLLYFTRCSIAFFRNQLLLYLKCLREWPLLYLSATLPIKNIFFKSSYILIKLCCLVDKYCMGIYQMFQKNWYNFRI